MSRAALVALISVSALLVGRTGLAQPVPSVADRARAYGLFLEARSAADAQDVEGAARALRAAMALDPTSATLPAELAELYLGADRDGEAETTANQALGLDPALKQAHRILGQVLAARASEPPAGQSREAGDAMVRSAITHLEQSLDAPVKQTPIEVRAMLSRLYLAVDRNDDAIALLTDIVKEAPAWRDGPALLSEAFDGAGRRGDAVTWFEEAARDNPELAGALGRLYAGTRRWREAAGAFERALTVTPRSVDLRTSLAAVLLSDGRRPSLSRARDVLRDANGLPGADERVLLLMSQAERRLGDAAAAEVSARAAVAKNGRNPRTYVALAEALEDQGQFQAVVDALSPVIAAAPSNPQGVLTRSVLLPHVGVAHQSLREYDQAIATFEAARALTPDERGPAVAVMRAYAAAGRYAEAARLAGEALRDNPDDVGLALLQAQALVKAGRQGDGVAVMRAMVARTPNDGDARRALAQVYLDAGKPADALNTLRDAVKRFPGDTDLAFELGATLDRQGRQDESERVFRQLLTTSPAHAQALNYLGYMFADRGVKLPEAVQLITRALAVDPDNGSYLDSLGWAYFKMGDYSRAAEQLQRAVALEPTHPVIQDHYADALMRLGRTADAIAAWSAALASRDQELDRASVERKLTQARERAASAR